MIKTNRLYMCLLFMTLSIFVFYRILRIYENFNNKIEIQTVAGSSPAIVGIMKDINSVGNQMLADSEYDKVDERILNARKL